MASPPNTDAQPGRPHDRHVLVVAGRDRRSARELQIGVASAAADDWVMTYCPPERLLRGESGPWWLRPGGNLGVLVLEDDPAVHAAAARLAAPVVAVGLGSPAGWTVVAADDRAAGRLAAEHLLAQGHRRFAVVAHRDSVAMAARRAGFAAALADAGFAAEPIAFAWGGAGRHAMRATLRALAPIAIFAEDDAIAHQVARDARIAGVAVPESVALIGCDDDDLLCFGARPQLSTVALPWRRMGALAASRLAEHLAGAPPVRDVLPPSGVVARRSSDRCAVDDRLVADALRRIQQRAGEAPAVKSIAAELGVARRTLEVRFRAALGRAPGDEIRRQRAERVRALLAMPGLSLADVARLTGHRTPQHLNDTCRRAFGCTPGQLRERMVAG